MMNLLSPHWWTPGARAILIEDEPAVLALLKEMQEDPANYTIINETDEMEAAKKAVALTKAGEADIPMKGLMQTSSFMKAILNKETGILPAGKVLSECTVLEYPDQNRLMFATDCAVNITPGVAEKKQLIDNAVELARYFGVERPKVAVITAVEKVNPKIASSVDADTLSKIVERLCRGGSLRPG